MKIKSIFFSSLVYLIVINIYKIIGRDSKYGNIKKALKDISNLNRQEILDEDSLDLSFQDRILKPMVDTLIRSVATLLPASEGSYEELNRKLSEAGLNMSPKDFRALNIIIMTGFACSFFLIVLQSQNSISKAMLGLPLGFFTGYIIRRFSIESKITKRKHRIKQQLPEVMDILSVSVVAGLGFDQALGYVIERSRGDLIDELSITQREINMGKTRKDSLSGLADRCQMEEVKTFTNAIIQADELGISLQSVLSSQSHMIRSNYRQEIEEKAAKIPVKILIPMVLFIFPVIFIVLLGPAVPSIIQSLSGV